MPYDTFVNIKSLTPGEQPKLPDQSTFRTVHIIRFTEVLEFLLTDYVTAPIEGTLFQRLRQYIETHIEYNGSTCRYALTLNVRTERRLWLGEMFEVTFKSPSTGKEFTMHYEVASLD